MKLVVIISTILSLMITSAKCRVNIVVVENRSGTHVQVQTIVETTSGKYYYLTCSIVNSTNYPDNEVVWRRKGKSLKSSPNLSFTPIKLRNRGLYFCESLNYGLSKVIYIVVKQLNSLTKFAKKTRWKRADVNPSTLSSNNVLKNYLDTANKNLSAPTKAYFFDWGRETFTIPFELKRNQPYQYDNGNRSKKDYSYAGVIIAVFAVILIIGFLLYRLMKRFDLLYATAPERISELEPACHHPTCGQYCTMPAMNSQENVVPNPYHNIATGTSNNNSNIPSPTFLPSLAGMSSTNNAQASVAEDLPPSYNTIRNCDKFDLPPTYNEALSYVSINALRSLPNQASFST